MDSKDKIEQLLKEIEQSISDYRDNVLQGKYADNFQKWQETQRKVANKIKKLLELQKESKSAIASWYNDFKIKNKIRYFNFLTLLTNHYIRKGNDKETAEQIVLQNKYIQNYTILEEINRQIDYHMQISTEALDNFMKNGQKENIPQFFSSIALTDDNTVLIPNKNIATFEKLLNFRSIMEKGLKSNLEQLQNYQDKNIIPEVENLGEIYPIDLTSESFLISEQELNMRLSLLNNQIQSLQSIIGMQKTYQFTIDNDSYQYVIPVAKKGEFLNLINELAHYTMVKKYRESNVFEKEEPEIEIVKNDSTIINTDQRLQYLEMLLLQIEADKRDPSVEVLDLEGNTKIVPAIHYYKYQEVFNELIVLVFSTKPEKNLSTEELISFYENRISDIERVKILPYVTVKGKEIPAILYKSYRNAKRKLVQLKGVEKQIDFDYAESLGEEDRLAYYYDVVRKITQSKKNPKLTCEFFGKKISIPTSYMMAFKKCESQIKILKKKRKYAISEKKVSTLSPEMEFVYYGRLIDKMRCSKDQPRISVDAFGETYTIPEKCLDTFQECLKRMNLFKDLQRKKKFKVKKIRKAVTNKIQNMSQKAKLAIASVIAGAAIGLYALSSLTSSYHVQDSLSQVQMVSELKSDNEMEILASEGQKEEVNRIEKLINPVDNNKTNEAEESQANVKQKFCSTLGAAVLPIDGAVISENPEDLTQKVSLLKDFQKVPCTIVKVNVRMPNNELLSISHTADLAQSYIDDLLNKGGVVESIGIVSQLAEENYKQFGQETGTIRLDQVNPIGNNTNLGAEIRASLAENEKGVSK